MGRTAALWHFDELPDVQPRDVAGGADDLVVPPELETPGYTDGIFGRARTFPVGAGLLGSELAAGQLRLRRSMSIEATVSVDELTAHNGNHVIVARGMRGSAAERRLYSLVLETSGAPSDPAVKLRMGWDEGTAPAVVPGVYIKLAQPGFVHLVVTREWVSPTLVRVSYYGNGAPLGTFQIGGGAIVDGEGGHVTIGCEFTGGAYGGFFLDAIDQVRISNLVRTAEEIQADYERMWMYQPWGFEAVKALAASMGDAYSNDPTSSIQRELMIDGDAIGYSWAMLNELLENYLPDRSTRMLDRWEKTCRIKPSPADTWEQRRERVLGFLRKVHGYNRDNIRKAIAPILDCEEDEITILENDNTGDVPEKVWLWFVYRNPALGGHPDFVTAQRVLNEIKPAHTQGVIGESHNFLCDDPFSLCDRDILGE